MRQRRSRPAAGPRPLRRALSRDRVVGRPERPLADERARDRAPAALCIWVISSASSRSGGGRSPGAGGRASSCPPPAGRPSGGCGHPPRLSRAPASRPAGRGRRAGPARPRQRGHRRGRRSARRLGLAAQESSRSRASVVAPMTSTLADESRLAGVLGRHDQPLVARLPRAQRGRERPAHGAQLAAQRELAADARPLERLRRELAARRQQPDRDREVEARPGLATCAGARLTVSRLSGNASPEF